MSINNISVSKNIGTPIIFINDYYTMTIMLLFKFCKFRLAWMYGDHSDVSVVQKMQFALDNARSEQAEIGLSKKNSEFW